MYLRELGCYPHFYPQGKGALIPTNPIEGLVRLIVWLYLSIRIRGENMRSLAICTVVLLSALIGGCATTTVEQRDYSSYFIGQTLSASVGESFLTDQGGSVRKYKHWVGILSSPDGWKVDEEYSPDYVRKELIYSGISGNVLDISVQRISRWPRSAGVLSDCEVRPLRIKDYSFSAVSNRSAECK